MYEGKYKLMGILVYIKSGFGNTEKSTKEMTSLEYY
jgi:hypothetical protein